MTARDLDDEPAEADVDPGDAAAPYADSDAAVEGAGSSYPDSRGGLDEPDRSEPHQAAADEAVAASASVYPDRTAFDGDGYDDGYPEDPAADFGYGGALAGRDGPAHGDVLVFDEPPPVAPHRPRPMSRAERRRRVRLQARRVRRVIRHIEPWSVLKISLFFYACLWVILLVAGVMIWGVADSSGTIGRLESLFVELFSLEEFTIDAGQVFRGYALAGLALAIAGTTFNVLMCLLFNLISDLTGGLRVTMIEEETARPAPPRRVRRRRPPMRR